MAGNFPPIRLFVSAMSPLRRRSPWISVLIFAMAVFICRSALAADGKPNLLFIIADDWGTDHAGAYGVKWVKTPAFDRVAREGVLFTRAYTNNAKCAPSRASILTGRNSWQLEEAGNHLAFFPLKFKTFPEVLKENGYTVGITGKGWGPGIARNADGSPRQVTGKPFNKHKAKPPTTAISNNDYAANFADFLETAPKDQPWSFWVGTLEPHRGYEFGSGVSKGGKQISDIPRVPAYWPDNETVRKDMLDYALEIEHFDLHLGRILEELERRNLLDNTIVVVTSDHGMPFPRVKGQAYPFSNGVPLAIRWPKGIKAPGRTVTDYVSLIDIAPTFIEAAGLKWSETGMAPTPGRSLSDILGSDKSGQVNPERDHAVIAKERHDVGRPHDWGYPIRGIIRDGFLYLRNYEPDRWPVGNPETGYLNTDGGATKTFILESHRANPNDSHWALNFGKRPAEELYDLSKDPDCITNLATSPEQQERKQKMEQQMIAELKDQGDPRMEGRGKVFDEYPVSDESNRNFYERFMAGEKLRAGWVSPSDFEPAPLEKVQK